MGAVPLSVAECPVRRRQRRQSGLLLFVLRATPVMGTLLIVHLASVIALYLTIPFSKFMHAPHRLGALLIDANERRREVPA